MGLMDDFKDKAGDVMNDPERREQIQKLAEDKGISLDEAKAHFQQKQQEE